MKYLNPALLGEFFSKTLERLGVFLDKEILVERCA